MTHKLAAIYRDFRPGSVGFIKAIATNCGYEISDSEIGRIATRAKTAEHFHALWNEENWWKDAADENE